MSDLIEMAKHATLGGRHYALSTFSHVPDEKLTWSPAPSAKSALRIAAHIGLSNDRLANVLQGRMPPPGLSFEELSERGNAQEMEITSREMAVKLIEDSTERYIAALDTLTADHLAGETQTPFGRFPTSAFIFICGQHMRSHAAQIDYLETVWGDLQDHF
jgi:hypothetical protein